MKNDQIKQEFYAIKNKKLFICIIVDLIGMSSYLLPFLGEGFDLIWAPISGLITYFLFKGKIGVLGGLGNTIEELFPATDIIPGATITWCIKYILNGDEAFKEFLMEKRNESEMINAFLNSNN